MALPTSAFVLRRPTPPRAGVTVEVYPSTVLGLRVEIQAATANTTQSSKWASVAILPPTSAAAMRFTIRGLESSRSMYIRARHPAQPGYSAGPFTAVINAKPKLAPDIQRPRLPQLTFKATLDEPGVKDLYDNGTVSAAFTIDWANGHRQKVTLAASSLTCTFKNPIAGAKNTLLLMQDVTGSRLLPVFDASVLWPGGTAPVLSTGGGLTDELGFVAQTSPTLRYYGSTVALGYLQPTPSVNGAPGVTGISVANTAHTINEPAAVTAGDLLLMFVAWSASPGTVTTPSGWTSDGTTSIMSVFHKVSDGTEGGGTVGVTTQNAVKAAAQVYRIQTWFGAVAGVTVALGGGSGTSADPSSVTPSWGADRDLWFAGVAVTANPTITDPANYGTFQQTDDGSVAVRLRTGRRTLYATTEDPAAFTWTGTQTWTAVTVSIRPPG